MKEILYFDCSNLIFTECETADGDCLEGEELVAFCETLLEEHPEKFEHPDAQMDFKVFFDGDLDYPERFESYSIIKSGYSGHGFFTGDEVAGGELSCNGAFALIEVEYTDEVEDLDDDALQETREDLIHGLMVGFSCAGNSFVSSQFESSGITLADDEDMEMLSKLPSVEAPKTSPCLENMDFSSFGETDSSLYGFTPIPLRKLLAGDMDALPEQPGVYIVFTGKGFVPEFREVSPAYRHKGKDPSVSIKELEKNWVSGSRVLYIGKAGGDGHAATIRQRFTAYVGFGQGRSYAHWGGRYLWQLVNAAECFVAVKADESPAGLETGLLELFRKKYGRLPFANLRG